MRISSARVTVLQSPRKISAKICGDLRFTSATGKTKYPLQGSKVLKHGEKFSGQQWATEGQQQQKLERAERVQQEQMINEAKEEQWREDQKKKKIEQAKKKNSPTIGQQLAFILGFLFVLFSYFIPVFGTMTLVTGGIFMVCSLLSEIATHLVRLKIALEESKSE